jgi:hypothetical protein
MGTVVDLATNWELLPDQFQGTVMSDNRDFERPREPFQASTSPTDLNMAIDTKPAPNQFIKQVQTIMRSNPLGSPYLGPVDGESNFYLLDILKEFQTAISSKSGKTITIVSGSSISPGAFAMAMKTLKDLNSAPPKEEIKTTDSSSPTTPSDAIKSFQSFFASDQPIIGKLYSGSIDGISNPELESAAKKAEALIAASIKNNKVYGSIWNDNAKTFNTNVADITSALGLILKHNAEEQAKKTSSFSHKTRILALSKLI